MTARRAMTILPSVGVSLLPKLTCPLCWPAYAGLLTTPGLGFLISARYLLAVTAAFLLLSIAALHSGHSTGAATARQSRGSSLPQWCSSGKFLWNPLKRCMQGSL